jgi:3-phenylpropionate/cinnamic acid dioxygenase small subunit
MDMLTKLNSRVEIQDLMARYCRAVDRRDWEALRACYHSDAYDAHGSYSGDVDGFIDWVSTRHAVIPFSMHFVGNCLIEFVDETTAISETSFVVFRRAPASDKDAAQRIAEVDAEVFGRYLDRVERRDGGWRYARRKVVIDETRTRPSQGGVIPAVGRRDAADPVYAWWRNAGLSVD